MLRSAGSLLLAFCTSLLAIHSAIAAQCYRTFSREDFPACHLLSDTYALHWKLDGSNATFGVDVDESPNGWVGLGVSEAGGMKGADLWVIQQTSTGGWSVQDSHSEDYAAPILDTSQDVSIVGKPVTNGNSIAVVITRKLKACDVSDLSIFPNISMPYLWAHAPKPGYHGSIARGSMLTQLLSNKALEPLTDVNRSALVMPDFSVPAELNSYWCTNFKLPADTKYHIVDALPNVTSPFVHHMLLFACSTPPAQPLNEAYECSSMMSECTTINLGWAPGGGSWVAPEEAGLPLSEYYALQVHYNNPEGMQGQKDSSGMTIGYTPKLRTYDIGVMTLGQQNISIPAGAENFTITPAVCPSECTSEFKEPLNIVAHAFHMHGLGFSIKTQHVRDGVELQPLDVLQRYDYNHQRFADPKPGVGQILPGDALITTCSYNASRTRNVTLFGERTEDEMCFDFLMYYPAQDINICMPSIPGIASCLHTSKFGEWRMKLMKQYNISFGNSTTTPPAPTTTPTTPLPPTTATPTTSTSTPVRPASAPGTSPPSNQPTPTESSSPSPPTQRSIMRQRVIMAGIKEGFFKLYDQAAYGPSGYTAFKEEGNCPVFLSAKDEGKADEGNGGSGAKSSGREGALRHVVGGVLIALAALAVVHL